MLIFGLFALIATCHSQVNSDWSFRKRCEFHGGTYTRRSEYTDTNQVGERCKATFSYPTGDPLLARKFCEETVPFHIIDATADGPRTTCLSEAGLICKTNWIQLYGRCYFMEKKQMTYSEAQGYCKKLNSGIAFMHRDILPVHWNNYYTKSAKAWVDGSSVYRDNLLYTKGDNMMLVFHGEHYRIKSLSLIRVDGSVEKAFPLCEYVPKMTRAESLYLLRRYSEIYHTGFTSSDGNVFVRTNNFLKVNDGEIGRRLAVENEYCSNSVKFFTHGAEVKGVTATSHRQEFADALAIAQHQQLTFARSSWVVAQYGGAYQDRKSRDFEDCKPNTFGAAKDRIHRVYEYKCDGGSWAFCVKVVEQQKIYLDPCSDALWGPLYCEITIGSRQYKPCPSGYSEYMRDGGVKWCHKHVATKLSAPDAEAKCREDGAHLSGAESMAEFNFMSGLREKNKRSWIGAERREACRWGTQGKSEKGWKDSGECSRELVFQWTNYAAINPPFFDDNSWIRDYEPNYLHEHEDCMELEEKAGKIGMNDMPCSYLLFYFCGREADLMD